jgi:uncharacterized membrane protein YhaH (DUF805 family)
MDQQQIKKKKDLLSGRLSRKNYIIVIVAYFVIIIVATLIGGKSDEAVHGVLTQALPMILSLFVLVFTVRRLHDVNLSGFIIWITILIDVPLGYLYFWPKNLNIYPATWLLTFFLMIKPSFNGPNKYGEGTVSSRKGSLVAFLIVILMILGIVFISVPKYYFASSEKDCDRLYVINPSLLRENPQEYMRLSGLRNVCVKRVNNKTPLTLSKKPLSETVDECEKDIYHKDTCYFYQAVTKKDVNYCYKVDDGRFFDLCAYDMAKVLKDETYCGYTSGDNTTVGAKVLCKMKIDAYNSEKCQKVNCDDLDISITEKDDCCLSDRCGYNDLEECNKKYGSIFKKDEIVDSPKIVEKSKEDMSDQEIINDAQKQGINLDVLGLSDGRAGGLIEKDEIDAWRYPERDSDNDGIKNIDEFVKYKTNPLKADTDGDGYGDKKEIDSGYDPLK